MLHSQGDRDPPAGRDQYRGIKRKREELILVDERLEVDAHQSHNHDLTDQYAIANLEGDFSEIWQSIVTRCVLLDNKYTDAADDRNAGEEYYEPMRSLFEECLRAQDFSEMRRIAMFRISDLEVGKSDTTNKRNIDIGIEMLQPGGNHHPLASYQSGVAARHVGLGITREPEARGLELVEEKADAHEGHFHQHVDRSLAVEGDDFPTTWRAIVATCRHLEDRYADAADEKNAGKAYYKPMKALFEECHRDKDFSRMRRIAEFRPRAQGKVDTVLNINWQKAFGAPYRGGAPKVFLGAIDTYKVEHFSPNPDLNKRAYNFAISIVQSSGTGKSRMFDQAARYRFTIPFNLREVLDGVMAYPPADDEVRIFFGEETDDNLLCLRFSIFLESLFRLVVEELNKLPAEASSSIAHLWYEHLSASSTLETVGPARKELYKKVVASARKWIQMLPATQVQDLNRYKINLNTVLQDLHTSLEVAAKQRSVSIHEPLNDTDLAPPVKILLGFDEAHTLTTLHQRGQRTPFHNLGHVLSWLNRQPIFAVFMSTNSQVRDLAPPLFIHPSHRDGKGNLLIPPFTELPYDIYAQDLDPRITLEMACSPEIAARFGRPIWYSSYTNPSSDKLEKAKDLISFAETKLGLGGDTAKLPWDPIPDKADPIRDNAAKLAWHSVRVLIDFDPTLDGARVLEARLVESHMRIAYAVPTHREYMRTGTPSEPILAEAAARRLHAAGVGIDVLSKTCQNGFIAKGERGELVARLLWIMARDAAILYPKHQTSLAHKSEFKFYRPFAVLDFLEQLLTPTEWDKIQQARPVGNSSGPTLKEAYEGAYMTFNQFSRAGDYKIVKIPGLERFLLRGVALQCHNTQKSIDMIAPVHFEDLDKQKTSQQKHPTMISSARVGSFTAQVKNRKRAANDPVPIAGVILDESQETLFPHLSLFMELGTEDRPGVRVDVNTDDNCDDGLDHYIIRINGISSDTYRVVKREDEAHLKVLLATSTVWDDFPRADTPASMELFLRQKPEFFEKVESMDWCMKVDE